MNKEYPKKMVVTCPNCKKELTGEYWGEEDKLAIAKILGGNMTEHKKHCDMFNLLSDKEMMEIKPIYKTATETMVNSDDMRYFTVLDAIKMLADVAYNNGYRIPKCRLDLRAKELVMDKKFWKAIVKFLEQ